MNEWYEKAAKKLAEGKTSGSYSRHASVMKDAVCEALDSFCKQDGEFAQAVVQGGAFADCMKAVASGVGDSISDLEAYRRAVRFYFPGADVRFHMTVSLCADVEEVEPAQVPEPVQSPRTGYKILDLKDFL